MPPARPQVQVAQRDEHGRPAGGGARARDARTTGRPARALGPALPPAGRGCAAGRGRAGWRRPRGGGGGGRLYGGRWEAWTGGRGVGKGGDGGRREAVPGEVSGRGSGEATQGGGWR